MNRGAHARRLRTERGLSLKQTARRAKAAGRSLDPATLSRLERGLQHWTEERELDVAAGLGVPVEQLWGEEVVSLAGLTEDQRRHVRGLVQSMGSQSPRESGLRPAGLTAPPDARNTEAQAS